MVENPRKYYFHQMTKVNIINYLMSCKHWHNVMTLDFCDIFLKIYNHCLSMKTQQTSPYWGTFYKTHEQFSKLSTSWETQKRPVISPRPVVTKITWCFKATWSPGWDPREKKDENEKNLRSKQMVREKIEIDR